MVATAVVPEDHAPPETVDAKEIPVEFVQTACVPLKVPAVGAAVTVISLVAVASGQPTPATVYVMVAVPTAIGVMTPVDASIVATEVLPDDQVPPAEVDVNVEVLVPPLVQIDCVPLKVPATGPAVIVTSRVAVALVQPPVPVTV